MAVQTHSPWITCFQPNPQAALRLFCFPYAGGGTLIFRDWSNNLPESIEVWAIQLPGREKRLSEPAFTSLDRLIPILSKAILPLLDKPFACFGHSMGGFIAFEVIRSLRHQNYIPIHLFVSACRAPHLPDNDSPIYNLPNDRFLAELRRLNGTPEAILTNAEMMNLLLPTIRSDFALIETYHYVAQPPIACSITALGGLQDLEIRREELAAWQLQTDSNFALHFLPGDHFFLHSERSHLLQLIFQKLGLPLH